MEASETSVSIVVPAFNEAGRIAESVRRIDTFIRQSQVPLDLIIVDDGSTDKTAEVVSGLNPKSLRLIRNTENHGKGYSVRQGVLAATGKRLRSLPFDLSTVTDPNTVAHAANP